MIHDGLCDGGFDSLGGTEGRERQRYLLYSMSGEVYILQTRGEALHQEQ
jgi:hypothetical protein